MLLQIIRWAYRLGVRNERHRIASFLSSASSNYSHSVSMFERELREDPVRSERDAKKRDIENRAIESRVNSKVINIIDQLFHAEDKYERGASVMFPDEEEL